MQNITIKGVILSLVSFYTFLLIPLSPLLAQERRITFSSDVIAPIIEHKPNAQLVTLGRPLTIEATIRDNIGVKWAAVFYRFMGTREYFSLSMHTKDDHFYSVTIPGQYVQEPGLEYYIEASDQAGNTRTFRGFEFSPLVIKVASVSSIGKAWYQKWWVWTIVGGIIVSAATVAASAGGGGGGGPSPPTGTASIDAPIP